MQVGKMRVAQTETGIEVEMYKHGEQEDIVENKSETDKSYRDKMRKEIDTGKWTE